MFVVAHDDDDGTFDRSSIFKMDITPKVGDSVIAYYDSRAYAFSGKAEGRNINGNWYIRFDDGDRAWIKPSWVHKKVRLS